MRKVDKLISQTSQSQKTQESAIHLNIFQEPNSQLKVHIQRIYSSLHVMHMVYYPLSQCLHQNKLCITSYQVTLLKLLELKLESKNHKLHSLHALVKLSSHFIQHYMLICWLKRLKNMIQKFGLSTLDGQVVNME